MRTCDRQCKVCLNDGAMIVAVAHACEPGLAPEHCHTTHWRESGLFSRAKKNEKQLGAKRWQVLGVESALSSLPSLSLLLSLSLYLSPPPPPPPLSLPPPPLSLSLSLFPFSLSLSVSLCQGTHTQKTVESMLILTVGPLTLHPTASTWVGKIRGA